MEYKKIIMALIVCLLFAGTAVAIGESINPKADPTNKPTVNATVIITNSDENILKTRYGFDGSIDENFFVEDVKNYENRTISFKLYKKDLFNGAETGSTSLYVCTDSNSETWKCVAERIKTVAELNIEKKALIEAKIASVAETARARAIPKKAVVGIGTVIILIEK